MTDANSELSELIRLCEDLESLSEPRKRLIEFLKEVERNDTQ